MKNERSVDSFGPEPQRETDTIGRLLQMAGEPKEPEPERSERVHAAVKAQWQAGVRRRAARARRRTVGYLAVAAVILAAALFASRRLGWLPAPGQNGPRLEKVVGTMYVLMPGEAEHDKRPARIGDVIPVEASLICEAGSRAAIQFGPDISVRLNHDTRVRYQGQDRLFLEQGAVYIDAHPQRDPGRTLVVAAEEGAFREIGTQFEVWRGPTGARVRVREGQVEFQRAEQRHLAKRGTEMWVKRDGHIETSTIALTGEPWEWVLEVAPSPPLDDRTLAEFLSWVVRENGWELGYDDEDLAAEAPTIRLEGSVEGFTPAEALAAILPTCGLAFHREGDRLVISRMAQRGATL
ncbi:FecR domain-containing protein [Sulfidibacter corallicola]|uniref:FecR domain-containing protein n=1 Tax=Sulfidibacter corallicola TaxID=2818388 RepID=A0A8A4TJU8_SULCO|nr:FecR family protein [Sulfidibacter corallicola]QTD49863.1 FecR domain-containing protein [Sulfidibacter corallicola]